MGPQGASHKRQLGNDCFAIDRFVKVTSQCYLCLISA